MLLTFHSLKTKKVFAIAPRQKDTIKNSGCMYLRIVSFLFPPLRTG